MRTAGDAPPIEAMRDSPHLALLSEAAGQLLAARDPRDAVSQLFDLVSVELRLDVYFNYLVEDGKLRLFSSSGLDEATQSAGEVLEMGAAVCGQVAETRRPAYVSCVLQSSEPRTEFLRAAGLDAYACTPMMVGDRLLGTLGFGRRSRVDFAPDELQFLRTITHYAAMAFERLRTEHALRESQRRLNAVLDNASVAIFLMDERQHCAYMNAAAEKLTGYRLEDTAGRPLHDVIHHTRPDGAPFPLEECPIDRAFPENNQEQGEEVFVHREATSIPSSSPPARSVTRRRRRSGRSSKCGISVRRSATSRPETC